MLITLIESIPSRPDRIRALRSEIAQRLRAEGRDVVANVFLATADCYNEALEQSHDHNAVLDYMAERACEIDGEIKKRLSQHPVANG